LASIAEKRKIHLDLIPLAQCGSEAAFLSSSETLRAFADEQGYLRLNGPNESGQFTFCIAEEDDLPEVSRLTVDAFGADLITLSGDLSQFERAFLTPGVSAWNAYSGLMVYAEVLSGLRSRMKDRLQKVDLSAPPVADASGAGADAETIAGKSSLILAVSRHRKDSGTDVIASVELRIQPTDAKIPFSQPWLDLVERKAAKAIGLNTPPRDQSLQPYLSNLCVSECSRGKRIGRALVLCVESIARDTWGYSKLYLHVDLDNIAALNLYKSEGYEDVGSRWNPFWAGGAAKIGYYMKDL